MSRKLITLDELGNYCAKNNIFSFQAESEEQALLVTVPATFAEGSSEDDQCVYLNIKACHTGKNKNLSYITEEAMQNALSSFPLKPILASIVEVEDEDGNKTLDFNGHDMEIGEDKMNPGQERINYIEQIVGVIQPDSISMDEEVDKDGRKYVYATGIIYKDYTYAADILEKRQDVNVSVELAVSQLSYDAEQKVLKLDKFKFSGMAMLGANVGPGMYNAHASLTDFSLANTETVMDNQTLMTEFASAIQKFNEMIASLSNSKEGETKMKFNELLEKYNVTADDITFDYENMSDEELETAFEEAFGSEESNADDNSATDEPETEPESTELESTEQESASDEQEESETTVEVGESVFDSNTDDEAFCVRHYSVEVNGEMKTFEVSLQEQINALYDLVNATYGETDNAWYGLTVYSDYVVMHDFWGGSHYKQTYSSKDGVFTLTGDRVQVYEAYVTAEEQAELDDMRANYSSLVDFKKSVEDAELHSQREAILQDERYAVMSDEESYKNLFEHMDDYSVEELTKEVKVLHSDYIQAHAETMNFSQKPEQKSQKKVAYGLFFDKSNDNGAKPYGTLFD